MSADYIKGLRAANKLCAGYLENIKGEDSGAARIERTLLSQIRRNIAARIAEAKRSAK